MVDSAQNNVDGVVYVGQDDHLFLSGGGHGVFSLFSGDTSPAPESAEIFWENVEARADFCTKTGRRFRSVVFPEKCVVMRGYIEGGDKIKSLYERCFLPSAPASSIGASVIYPFKALSEVSDAFSKTDTHCSSHGAIAVMRALTADIFPDEQQLFLGRVKSCLGRKDGFSGDLGRKFNPERVETIDGFVEKVVPLKQADNGVKGGNDGIMVLAKSSESISNKTLLIFGDSFFRQLIPLLGFFYRKIIFCRTRFFHYEMIDAFQPDDVFCGVAERYLSKCSADEDRPHFLSYPAVLTRTQAPSAEFSTMWKKFVDRKALLGTPRLGQANENRSETLLHIGGQKCGSSALQGYLFFGRYELARKKKVYLDANLGENLDQAKSHALLLPSLRRHGAEWVRERLKRLDWSDPDKSYILSSEGFCQINNAPIYAAALKPLSEFSEVHIVLYVRPQVDVLYSGWQQWGLDMSFEAWVEHALQRDFANWKNIWQAWREQFPQAKFTVRLFDRNRFPNKDMAQDFRELTGWPEVSRKPRKPSNPTYDDLTVMAIRKIAKDIGQPAGPLCISMKKAGLVVSGTRLNHVLRAELRDMIVDRYRRDNAEFLELVGLSTDVDAVARFNGLGDVAFQPISNLSLERRVSEVLALLSKSEKVKSGVDYVDGSNRSVPAP